jgi:glutaredoxin
VIEIRIYTRQSCPLCDEMKELADRVARDYSARVEAVDIDLDRELVRHYDAEVPVLFVNGRKFAKYRVGEATLRWKLLRESLKTR